MFFVFDRPIMVDAAREAYNKYRLLFQEEADRAQSRFYQFYQQNRSLDDVIKNTPEQIKQSITPVIESCVNLLVQHNILIIDTVRFEEEYPEIQDIWAEPFLRLCDQYAEITLEQKALDEYRVARREGRSRWSGGGFGLSGALKGAATAGALNLVTGAGHMLFNGVGKLVSSASAASKKNKIYCDPETYSSLAQGVWDATFALHYALIDCLKRNGADPLPSEGAISAEDKRNATAVLNNAKNMSDEGTCRSALLQSVQLNPYQSEWYLYVLDRFGDKDGNLETVARYFGMTTVQEEKRQRLDRLAQSLPLDTEDQAQAALSEVQKLRETLHCLDDTANTRKINEAIMQFDEKYRTVEGITFSTRAEASTAREEITAIDEIEAGIDYKSLPSIAEAEQRISTYTTPAAKSRQKELHQKWVKLDEQLRTVNTLLPDGSSIRCRTFQQADELRPIVSNLKQRLDSCGEDDEPALLTFKSQLSSERIPSALAGCYLAEIDRRLSIIDKNARTALGKEYPTRDAAKVAERKYAEIKEAFRTEHSRKNGVKIRTCIEEADFSESVTKELLDELFRFENSKELKTAKMLTGISTVILLFIVIGSYFFSLSGTVEFSRKDVIVKGVSLMVKDVQVVNELGFADGLKNGFVVFGRCVGDIFVEGFSDYIDGFYHGWLGNIVWAVLGLIWIVLKQCIIFLPRYLVSLVLTFFQSASFSYYLGYVVSSAIPLVVSQFNFDEDTPEENVQRIKAWTIKKVVVACLVVALLIALIVFFFQSN